MSSEPGALPPAASSPRLVARVYPRWLPAARIGWLIMTLVIAVLFVIGQWFLYGALQLPCTSTGCEAETFYLTAREIAAFQAQGFPPSFYAAYQVSLYVIFFLTFATVGALIFRHSSHNGTTLFFAYALVLWGGTFPSIPYTLWTTLPVVATCMLILTALGGPCFFLFVLLFPNGRFVPRWMRWVAPIVIINSVVNELSSLTASPLIQLSQHLQLVLVPSFLGSVVIAQVYRYRRISTITERQQTKWVLLGIVLGLSGVLAVIGYITFTRAGLEHGAVNKMVYNGLIYTGFLLIPLSIGAAVLRSRLWAIDVLISRTLLYGVLTACVIGIYVLIVGYLGAVFRSESNRLISLVATGLVAILFQPLRVAINRTIRRRLFGERDDPYAVLSRLGQHLEATLAPDDVLPTTVATIRDALKLPYVAIALRTDALHEEHTNPTGEQRAQAIVARTEIVAAVGVPVADPLALPLFAQGEHLGLLLLAPRTPGEDLNAADRRLLADLARQAGLAVQRVRLTLGLKQSRERIIAAREEERRRLRRDLHDGLGPALATLAIQVEAARELLGDDPTAADLLLAEVTSQVQTAINDIRRLVYALRPPALDDLGLVGALRAYVARYDRAAIRLEIVAPDQMRPLPAAVEVAAFRIVQEAVTNVIRHAQADHCVVMLMISGSEQQQALAVEILDDGRGLPLQQEAGVGLVAMRERAAEVGGSCSVESVSGGGTRIRVVLPLGSTEGTEMYGTDTCFDR